MGTVEYDIVEKDYRLEETAELLTGYSVVPYHRIQRHFNIGYNTTDRILRQLEALGIVGPLQKSGPEGSDAPYVRLVLIGDSLKRKEILSKVEDTITLVPSKNFVTLAEFEDVAREVINNTEIDSVYFKHLFNDVVFLSRSRGSIIIRQLEQAGVIEEKPEGGYRVLINNVQQLEQLLSEIRSGTFTPLAIREVNSYNKQPGQQEYSFKVAPSVSTIPNESYNNNTQASAVENSPSESSLDRVVGGVIFSVIRIILAIACFPLLIVYWEFVAIFYLYVGIPCYIIKRVSPRRQPAIDAFFDKAWNKIMKGHHWYIVLFFGTSEDSDGTPRPDKGFWEKGAGDLTTKNRNPEEENEYLTPDWEETRGRHTFNKATILLVIIIIVFLIIAILH